MERENRWEDNIIRDLRDIDCDDVSWIELDSG
jgi:hypothetical protein